MKKLYFILLLLLSTRSFAQKTIVVLDKNSLKPIENVNITAVNNAEGTYTNADGKAKLLTNAHPFKLSHLNYNDTTININNLKDLDSLFLTPSYIELKEVQISTFNLRKRLSYVLEHYNELYVNVPTIKDCAFKEVYLLNNQYKRLILSQLAWWSKSARHPIKGYYNDFVRMKLGNISFYKNDPMGLSDDDQKKGIEDTKGKESAMFGTQSILNHIYLNYVIEVLLSYPEEIKSTIEAAPLGQLIVTFETGPNQSNNFSSVAKGRITFDEKTKAVIQYSCEQLYENNLQLKKDKKGRNINLEVKKTITNYTLSKSINNLWSLKHCDIHLEGFLDYINKKNTVIMENSFYVLKETEAKKIKMWGNLNFKKGIYENFPNKKIVNSNPILLSSAEQNFINKK